MREQEVRELYEAYMQVHQPQEEVEQLDEDAPERITKPSRNKRLMKDAGPARVHNPKKVEEEFEQVDEDKKYDRNRQRAAQRAAARNEARRQGKTGNVPGVGYVSPRPEGETYRDSAGVERHTSGARMPQKEEVDLFDIILEHLVAEGYADTNEAALAIMANMSEEWRRSIVEGDALQNTIKYLEGKRDAMNANKSGSANTAAPGKQSVGAAAYKAYQRLQGV